MIPSDLNVLKWYPTLQEQNFRQDAAQGDRYKLITSIYKFPPFSLVKDQDGANINYLQLVSMSDGSLTNILSTLVSSGLEDNQYASKGYDTYVYPSSVNTPLGVTPGQYYAHMKDSAGNEWYSELITFVEDTTNMVSIEWFHLEAFEYHEGHIQYKHPYKNRCVIATDIGKPVPRQNNIVDTRDGRKFPSQKVSYFEHNFWFHAPEYLIDALRVVDLHDCKEIHYRGKTYRVEEIQFEPEWTPQGNYAWVQCTFITDTIVVINGRAVGDKSYEADEGNCLYARYTCLGELTTSNPDYINKTWQASPMNDGDKFVIVDGALNKTAQQYNTSTDDFSTLVIADDDIVYVTDTQTYYFQDGTLIEPIIDEVLDTPDRVKGRSFPNSMVEVWLRDINGVEWMDNVGTQADFEGTGIPYTLGEAVDVQVRVSSVKCNQFSKSGWVNILGGGIGAMIIEGTNPPFEVT